MDPLHISRTTEARVEILHAYRELGPYRKKFKSGHTGLETGSRDLHLNSAILHAYRGVVAKVGHRGSGSGHLTCFLNLETPSYLHNG